MEKPFATSSGKEALLEREPSWPELLGCNNWEGLLGGGGAAINPCLRRHILRCGNFSEATYDAFEYNTKSKYAGSSKYGKKNFFHKVMLESAADYQVECFLYATADGVVATRAFTRSLAPDPWDRKYNFMGYIATTTDEVSKALGRREIYVAWRGTVAGSEWRAELCGPFLASAEDLLADKDHHHNRSSWPCCWCTPKVEVEAGFLKIYLSKAPDSRFSDISVRLQVRSPRDLDPVVYSTVLCSKNVQKKISQLIKKYKNENPSIIVTGHSLGASLSVLSALDLVENVVTNHIPVSVIIFACPKVGNRAFRKRVSSHPNLKILHIKNTHDWIPCVPFCLGHVETGIELVIDHNKSPNLKRTSSWKFWKFGNSHNLEAMLHVIAGWNGPDGEFGSDVKRSKALVNKSSNILKDELLIPDSWLVEEKKGMVFDDGEWIHAPPLEEDVPVPENFDD